MRKLALLALAWIAPVAQAAPDAVACVDDYLARLTTATADFVQVVQDRRGDVTERASGTLALWRPNRFRWDYREPHPQVIVADGRRLWLHDPDLEQVTVRTLEQGLGSTPAMLLSGAGKVGESFTAGAVEKAGGLRWCRLAPRARTSDFERVSLAFDATGELAALELVDKLGQTTTIQFARLQRGAKLDEARFNFVPPAGADVIGDAGGR